MTFGEKIIRLRKSKGITQEQLAEQMGVTRQTISKWELDQSTPDLSYIKQLCEIFGVTADYLIDENKTEPETSRVHVEQEQPSVGHSEINRKFVGGIIVTVLGFLSLIFGVVFEELLVILGLLMMIIGFEMVFVKKRTLLAVMWTLWVIFWLFYCFFMVNKQSGTGGVSDVIYGVVSIVGFVLLFRATKKKK